MLDDGSIVYLNKQDTYDSIELLDTGTNTASTLVEDRITAQSDFSISPDGRPWDWLPDCLEFRWPNRSFGN